MSEPRTVPCTQCGYPRKLYRRIKGDLCTRCVTKNWGQHAKVASLERAADRAARHPGSSWWTEPDFYTKAREAAKRMMGLKETPEVE